MSRDIEIRIGFQGIEAIVVVEQKGRVHDSLGGKLGSDFYKLTIMFWL
jgi:hypothetical protein